MAPLHATPQQIPPRPPTHAYTHTKSNGSGAVGSHLDPDADARHPHAHVCPQPRCIKGAGVGLDRHLGPRRQPKLPVQGCQQLLQQGQRDEGGCACRNGQARGKEGAQWCGKCGMACWAAGAAAAELPSGCWRLLLQARQRGEGQLIHGSKAQRVGCKGHWHIQRRTRRQGCKPLCAQAGRGARSVL